MNQNQNQQFSRIRQISSQEAAKAQGISVAELQKTQVLNLKAVEEAVRFEKLTSKKPAIVVGIIGLMLVLFGTTFQIVDIYQSKSNNTVEKRKVVMENVDEGQKLVCKQKSQVDSIAKDYIISYRFDDNKLVGFTKTLQLVSSDSVAIQNLRTAFQGYINQIDGYSVKVEAIDSGLKVVVDVDFNKLDLLKLNPIQQQHYATKIDYALDTTYNRIKTDMVNGSYTCQ